jgi:hypothetical protein
MMYIYFGIITGVLLFKILLNLFCPILMKKGVYSFLCKREYNELEDEYSLNVSKEKWFFNTVLLPLTALFAIFSDKSFMTTIVIILSGLVVATDIIIAHKLQKYIEIINVKAIYDIATLLLIGVLAYLFHLNGYEMVF